MTAPRIVDLRRRRRRARGLRVLLGLSVWGLLGFGGWRGYEALAPEPGSTVDAAHPPIPQLVDYVRRPRLEVQLVFERPCRTRVGDPIFAPTGSAPLEQIGVITSVANAEGPVLGLQGKRRILATGATAWLYPTAPPLGQNARLAWYPSDQSLAWIVQTMLPEERRAELQRQIDAAAAAHGEELVAAFAPVVRASLRDALQAVQGVLPDVLRDHRDQMQQLGMAWQEEFVKAELMPLIKTELFPLVERRARPVLTPIGKEIWSKVSLWRFGSRWIWDSLPLTSGESVEKEWNRVLKEEALPVVQAHSGELLGMVRQIIVDASRNPAVRETLRKGYGRALDDERIHELLWSVFRQAVVDNEALHDAVIARWQGEPAQAAIDLAGRRLDPLLRRIGDTLLGTREDGITPEFAAVLRNRLLLKDQQWFVLETGASDGAAASGSSTLTVVVGSEQRDPFARGGADGR